MKHARAVLLFVVFAALTACSEYNSHSRPENGRLSCDNFPSQGATQAHYESQYPGWRNLDGDGIACEGL